MSWRKLQPKPQSRRSSLWPSPNPPLCLCRSLFPWWKKWNQSVINGSSTMQENCIYILFWCKNVKQFVQQVPSSTYRAPKEIQIIEECKEKNQLKAEVRAQVSFLLSFEMLRVHSTYNITTKPILMSCGSTGAVVWGQCHTIQMFKHWEVGTHKGEIVVG